MNCWQTLPELLAHEDLVLVTVAQTRGSVPREAGANMLVSMTRTVDTIGGGHLEWEAMAHARAMLLQPSGPSLVKLSLGASLGQCCGGVVWLVFERIAQSACEVWTERSAMIANGTSLVRTLSSSEAPSHWHMTRPDEMQTTAETCLQISPFPSPGPTGHREGTAGTELCRSLSIRERVVRQHRERGKGASNDVPSKESIVAYPAWRLTQHISRPAFNITIFGAGHVGAAIVQVLSTLDSQIRWVDVRDDLFGSPATNVTCIATGTPEEEVDNATPDTFFLVLTHSHTLDLELTARILRRDAFAWFGLIGSRTKRARFEHRLHAQGISPAQLARMTCPIGVPGIGDKSPQAIAIAVVAQLLQAREQYASSREREFTHDDAYDER
ncbi:MAG: xanthine dehydrogenase accessory protein XdhC [Rhodocyclales bacterium]|nr:xanthine dehydrogenase accessory protein XdhC [Rhodocyclales bacterium]